MGGRKADSGRRRGGRLINIGEGLSGSSPFLRTSPNMRTDEIINTFPLPDVAVQDLQRRQMSTQDLSPGVSVLSSGHHNGINYRFFIKEVRNPIKSEITGFPHYDTVELIEYDIDDRTRPAFQVRPVCELPTQLLAFDKFDGSCKGGLYQEAYERFKAGMETPGLPLRRWGVIDEAAARSLEELKIFTVEQLAAQPRNKIESRFPEEFKGYFQQAIEYVNGKDTREQASKQAEQLMEVLNQNSELTRQMEGLKAQLASVMSLQAEEAPRRGRPRKHE